ncbi:pyridoxal phosphate-dependent decarboxylase family protein [Aestuariispira ectoiniformans]|uniref:pyridoxal phosphate-dependent decarboxylase family protein n=1 Tax=Aestuariispira ectoiniformans TaxID=2775080 RepID=UPI00223BD502|nr:pyridoxal-dependent decarboxylase [Aestuariispira ectoiniformans]
MSDKMFGDAVPDRLDRLLHETADNALRFLGGLNDRAAAVVPSPVLTKGPLPEEGVGLDGAMAQYQAEIEPYLSASAGSRYFGFVTGGVTPAALVGDWLASAVDQNPPNPGESIAPSVTDATIGQLLDLFDLPREQFDGCFTTGATAANFLSLIAAREWWADKLGVDVTGDGMAALPDLKIFSACPHSSMVKVMGLSGVGRNALVPVDQLPQSEAMDPEALDKALLESDASAKIVVASAGTVTATDFDDLNRIADICASHDAWLHVDGAFGLFARCLPEMAGRVAGIERADSITADFHKWLNVPYDCGLFLTRHVEALEKANAMDVAYLKIEGEAPTYMNRSLENSQRFRALPVWMTLQAYGRDGVRDVVRRNCSFAAKLADWIEQAEGFELLTPVKLNVVCFRALFDTDDQDAANKAFLQTLNEAGSIFCTPGALFGKAGVRAAISNWRTTEDDLPVTFKALEEAHAATAQGLK